MNDFIAHGLVAFLLPLAWGLVIYPLARRFNKDWILLLVSALFLSFIIMIVKELGDQQISRNDIVADLAGLFFGTAVLSFLFISGNAAVAKEGRLLLKPADGISFRKSFHFFLPGRKEISLRELLSLGLKLSYLGSDFFQKVALIVKDQNAKRLCLQLAQGELQNAARLSTILNAWLPQALRPSMVEWTQTFIIKNDLYIKNFSENASEKEVIKYAIWCKARMMKFYAHFESSFPESWKRMQLNELIQDQDAHKAEFEAILQSLRDRGID